MIAPKADPTCRLCGHVEAQHDVACGVPDCDCDCFEGPETPYYVADDPVEAEFVEFLSRVALFSNDSWLAQEASARHRTITGAEPSL